jgi:hypothetical protein
MQILGVVLMVLGSISGCMAAFSPLALLAPRMSGQPVPAIRDLIVGAILYLLIAVLLIVLGTGSFRLRRWSRPVILVITGTWALSGLLSLVSWVFIGAGMEQIVTASAATASTQPGTPGAPGGVAPVPPPSAAIIRTMSIAAVGFMFLFGVLLPGGIFWFYRRQSVQQTLDYFSPGRAWTDQCPIPVLGMSLWLAGASLWTVMFCFTGVIPVFGTLKSGPVAIAALVAIVVLLAILARGIFRQSMTAWWGTALLVVLVAASTLLTFSIVDPLDFYRRAGTPRDQLEMLKLMGMAGRGPIVLSTVLYSVVVLGYLTWILKYFRRAATIGVESS